MKAVLNCEKREIVLLKKKKKKNALESWIAPVGFFWGGEKEEKRKEMNKKINKSPWLEWKKGTIMGSLLLSLVYMLATTCIYLQVMVIHQLPEGSQIMVVLLLWWGVQGKSLCDVASGSLQPLRRGKNLPLHPFLSSSDPPAEVVQGKKKKKHMRRI